MVLRMKNVNILGVHWKNWTFKGGGVTKNQYRSGVRLNKGGGGLRQFANIRGDLERKGAGGVDIPMHTMYIKPFFTTRWYISSSLVTNQLNAVTRC